MLGKGSWIDELLPLRWTTAGIVPLTNILNCPDAIKAMSESLTSLRSKLAHGLWNSAIVPLRVNISLKNARNIAGLLTARKSRWVELVSGK